MSVGCYPVCRFGENLRLFELLDLDSGQFEKCNFYHEGTEALTMKQSSLRLFCVFASLW